MLDVLAIIPFKTPAFHQKWFSRVFSDFRTGCLFLGHPSTEVLFQPDRSFLSIRQGGSEVHVESRAFLYLPASTERQHTGLAKIKSNRYADFVAREWDVVTHYLEDRLSTSGKWVNSPASARRASNKMLQLQLAKDHDLMIPPTVITNSPKHAAAVLPRGATQGLCKPIGESGNISADWMAPTSFFTREEISQDGDSIQVSPACFQRYIPARMELRTYIYGSKAITVAVRPRGKSDTPDLTCQDLQESDFAFTTDFQEHEAKLITLVKEFGLLFAAVDSLVYRDRCYFLEINPSGGWGWLPAELQVPLDREFRQLVLS